MIFDSIMDMESVKGKGEQKKYLLPIQSNTSLATSMPNLSLSLESFIRDCARGNSSTPKKASQIPMGCLIESMLPTSKTTDNGDCGLERISIYKSMPDIERQENEVVNFYVLIYF